MTVWGYILQGPGRPSLAKQREVLRVLGVDLDMEYPPVWLDKLERVERGGAKAGERQLDERNGLLLAVHPGDKVAVAMPFCMGLSKKDAEWFLAELAARGVSLVVANDAWEIAPGNKAERVLEEIARAQNTTNVAAYRKRRST
jgi:hypothetical protein